MPRVLKEKLIRSEKINKEIYKFTISSEYVAETAKAGQFVNIRCSDGVSALLRRPISICKVNRKEKSYDVIFQVKGNGTDLLSKKQVGDEIDVIAPVGNGFDLSEKYKNILVVGGGIGVFPLLGLLEDSKATKKTTVLGFRNKDFVVLEKEFQNASDELVITTDDGTFGKKGFVTEYAQKALENGHIDMVYACGPTPMIKAIKELAAKYNVQCQVSMEQRMGCGIGACLVCACKTKHGDEWEYSHVCSDGPVFNAEEVIFE